MRIMFRISIRMVQAVHDAIRPRAQVRRTLGYIRKYKKELFPKPTHGEGLMGGVTVLKKRLGKKGQIPMQYKGNKDNNQDVNFLREKEFTIPTTQ